MTTKTEEQIPEGYLRDAQGRLVPQELVKEVDRERDELVRELVAKAREVQQLMAKFRAQAMDDIQAFIQLSGEKYDTQVGGKKGNVTLVSFDGRYKVQRHISEHLVFDERLQVAKEMIDQCIHRWTDGSRSEIRALVEHAFQVDKEGKISTGRVLGLRTLDITDPQWLEAMQAISDSVRVAGAKAYVRFYERESDGKSYRPIPLDLAAL